MKFDAKLIIPAFDLYLQTQGLKFSAIAIGGSALSIMGIIDRHTRDLDLLTTPIPLPIQNAALSFSKKESLDLNWLNNAPSELSRHLPQDWMSQTVELYSGKALTLHCPCRLHMIYAKFWAMCDRDRDLDDLLAMKPSTVEITEAVHWTKPLDANPQWSAHVEATASRLSQSLSKFKGLSR